MPCNGKGIIIYLSISKCFIFYYTYTLDQAKNVLNVTKSQQVKALLI